MTHPRSTLRLSPLLLVFVITFSSSCKAQHSSAIKVHVLEATWGMFTVTYERAFSNRISAQLSLQGGRYSKFQPNRNEKFEVPGVGAVGAVRYFPFTGKVGAPAGFFSYCALRYMNYTEIYVYIPTNTRYEAGGQMYNAGLGIGYKLAYRRVALETFIGWGVGKKVNEDKEYRNSIPKFFFGAIEEQKHFPQLDFALCYLFGKRGNSES